MLAGFSKAAAITPHDTNPVAPFTVKAIYVGGAGNITFTPLTGTQAAADVVLTGVLVGHIYPISPKKVKAATTATLLVALGD